MNVGRIVGTAVVGFFFLLFVALDLVLFGVIALNSVVVTVLPLLGLVLGAAVGTLVARQQRTG